MCDTENEKLTGSSEEQQEQCVILLSLQQQFSLTGEIPSHASANEEKDETDGGTDELMELSVKDENIFPATMSNQPLFETVPLLPTGINQHASCQTGETENTGLPRQDYGLDVTSNEADADLDHGCSPEMNPDRDLQGLCTFFCQSCRGRFTTKQSLERHIRASCHKQTFKCRHCRMCFNTQFGRRRHERRHNNANRATSGVGVSPSPQGVGKTPEIVTSQEEDQNSLTSVPDPEVRGDSDESGDPNKASFVCQYCKKAFGTHTNLRRHERRIHERRLLPRGVHQRGSSSQELQNQQPFLASDVSSTDNTQNGEEIRQEGYMVDISSSISENLSFYIDGKIISASAVNNCETMELNSAAVIGLDALIISASQITQALKIESNDGNTTSDLCDQHSGRRRTSTPPLLPQIKTDLESESILTTPSSASEGTLIGTVLPRHLETIVLQKQKTIYLSPKLKQLLQIHDSSKSAFSFITEGQKPLSLTVLPATTTRFKRRTTSPTSSPQQSSISKLKPTMLQDEISPVSKLPKMDIHSTSPVTSLTKKDEMDTLNLITNDRTSIQQVSPLDCSTSGTGGRSCNQQPLDLSSAVTKRECGILDECVLDLSMSRKSTESDSTLSSASQTLVRRSKPNSSMLEKVLLNQYTVLDAPAAEDNGILSVPAVTDLAVTADPIPGNSEKVTFELSLPSSATLHTTPSSLNPAVLNTTPSIQSLTEPILSPVPPEVQLPVLASIATQDLQPLCSTAQSSIPVVPNTPIEISVGNSLAAFNVSVPELLGSAPGGMTYALIPTTPALSLQSPPFLTDPSVAELGQRTMVIDSVLSPDMHLFPPSVLVNQPNITPLSFPPNMVVIEYTVALESTNSTPVIQANAVNSVTDKIPQDYTEVQGPKPSSQVQTAIIEPSVQKPIPATQDLPIDSSSTADSLENPEAAVLPSPTPGVPEMTESNQEPTDNSVCPANLKMETVDISHTPVSKEESSLPPLCKRFMCNACDEPFQSMKGLSQHIGEHSDAWPYKCEFCVQLFESDTGLLEHRSSFHGIGKIYVCRICSKEFAFFCNLEQHHKDLHPGQECSHTEVENGKLRPENHNSPTKTDSVTLVCHTVDQSTQSCKSAPKAEEDNDFKDSTEELYTTIKIMASEGVKTKDSDVRLGINQHYPSYKPPPFPYHNRTPAGTTTTTTATNFSTHNIPQTYSTTIRCTKCGKGFDNMPELHKHILACANASDKKRYTPKKNPIPLKQFAKVQNGVLLPAKGVNLRQDVFQKLGQFKKLNSHETEAKVKLSTHSKKKSLWVQRGRPVGRKGSQDELGVYVCPHCSREFTYPASLKKHVAISCPLRPICRKLKRRKSSMTPAQENNGRIRTRVTDVIIKSQRLNHGQKTKAQTNESGSANVSLPVKGHTGKGKITVHNFRPKRSDILSNSGVHISKKSKLILVEAIQSPLASNKSPVTLRKSHQPNSKVQGMKREIKQIEMVLKPSAGQQFPLRMRERAGGPITRSLQQANVTLNTVNNTTIRKVNAVTPGKYLVQPDRQNGEVNQPGVESKK